MNAQIMDHNVKAAAMWGGGGRAYDEISRSIAGASEHCVFRLNPTPGERVADVATGTGWTSRAVARCGADVVGIDIAEGMLAAAAAWTPNSAAVTLRQVLQPFMTPPPVPPSSPFVWGTRDWVRDTLGRDFRVNSEEGTVVSRFHSIEATWDAYVNGFGPVRAVAAGQQADGLQAMRQALLAWAREFTTDLGVSIPIDYLVTVGTRV